MDWNEFCVKVNKFFSIYSRRNFYYDKDKILYQIDNKEYTYTKEEYIEFVQCINGCDFSRYSLLNKEGFEALLYVPDYDKYMVNYVKLKLRDYQIFDEVKKINYSLSSVSDKLIWFILNDLDFNFSVYRRYDTSRFEWRCYQLEDKGLFNVLRLIMGNPFSITINSGKLMRCEYYINLMNSFLFNFILKSNLVIQPCFDINNILKRPRIKYKRTQDFNDMIIPRLIYNEGLVEKYKSALLTNDSFVSFMNFYHIIEYFYEEIYTDELYLNVKNILDSPSFSPTNKKDIGKLVNLIKSKTRKVKEDFDGTELEALELVLRKYVNVSHVVDKIKELDLVLIKYYNRSVSFSKGNALDLENDSNDIIYKALANRIYKTRNALVHNKSNDYKVKERGIYNPFNDSEELERENILMKFIVGEIIINSAINLKEE